MRGSNTVGIPPNGKSTTRFRPYSLISATRLDFGATRSVRAPSGEVRGRPCYDPKVESGAPAPIDAELVDGLRSGDPRTFELLVRNEGPRMLSVTRRILKDDDEAREAVQEAFVSAFRARTQFHADSRI